MKRSISLLMFTVIALFSACNLYDQPEIDNGDSTVREIELQLSIPGIETQTRAIGATEENYINSIYVIAFKIDGENETFDYAVPGTKIGTAIGENGSVQSFKVTAQIKDYPQRFVIISNADAEVAELVSTATATDTKASLLADLEVSLGTNNRWNAISASDYDAFPMWGESVAETVTSATTSLSQPIKLLRMVAKINVQLDQANGSVTSVFKLKSVHLYNINNKGRVVPLSTNVNDGKAIAPTIPTTATLTRGPIEYTDLTTPGITNIAMLGTIYLFETAKEAAVANRLNATCVVIGGLYGSDTDESYYRVDITENGSFIDILRNHQYTIKITKISGRGYETVDEAFNAKSINIESEIIARDESAKYIATDGQYVLSVSEKEFLFEETAVTASSGGNIFTVFTDYTSGWSVEKIVDAAGNTIPDEDLWLTLSSNSGAANVDATITLTVPQNDTGADRSAIVWIAAGRLRLSVKVTQEIYTIAKRFARSNIVWTGSKLTFATTAAENASIPANSQGVLFQWGSLVAISPATLASQARGTRDYKAGKASTGAGHIVYSPTGTYTYAWTSIPYISSTADPFHNGTTTDDDFATYNGGQGWDNGGRGDICRYISSQTGWVSGNWRLPTADEYAQLLAELPNGVSNGGTFTSINVSPAGGTNHYGYYKPLSGRWLGAGVAAGGSETAPAVGLYFPAGGYRFNTDGTAGGVDGYGWNWTASSGNATLSYYLQVGKNNAGPWFHGRQNALPVRCVQE